MNKSDIEKLKQRVCIVKVAQSYGGQVTNSGKIRCVFHSEAEPSMKLYLNTNRYKCFGCGAKGDVIDLVKKMAECSFPDALEILKAHSGKKSSQSLVKRNASSSNKATAKKNVSKISDTKRDEMYHFLFDQLTLTSTGLEYLFSRGLKQPSIDRFRIKSIDYPYHEIERLKQRFSAEELIGAGLINGKGNPVFWLKAIVFPYYKGERIVYYSTRNITVRADLPKVFKLLGREHFYTGNLGKDELVVFEGIFDALSYYQMTGKDNFVSVNGAIDEAKIKRILEYYQGRLILCFDNDVQGALARWSLEGKNIMGQIDFNIINWRDYLSTDQDIYLKIRENFDNYKQAKEYFTSKQADQIEYVSPVKDFNDLLKKGAS